MRGGCCWVHSTLRSISALVSLPERTTMSYSGISEMGPSPYDGLSPMDDLSTGGNSIPQVSSTESQQPTLNSIGSDVMHQITVAQFEKQPPDNMRKSNFFNFTIQLYDGSQQPIEVHKAAFKDFYDTHSNGQEYRNGLIYKLQVVYRDGTQKEEELYVRLIDSHTKQLVPYEGTCKNPDFRRVLLTHELICSRCLEHRSCGNKNDTPSDPIIFDRFHLKFFVKCNQNCLKNAGNPKDSRRRFQVALYCADNLDGPPLACSESMFVHNNSKHGRRPQAFREAVVVGDGKPYIISVYPSEGWTTGGAKVCIVGMNFFEGMDVVFGTLQASAEVLSPNAIAVKAPQSPRPGEVDITLVFKHTQFCINSPGKFVYLVPDQKCFEHNFSRLERLLRSHDDLEDIPKEILLKRAADALETFYSFPRAGQTPGGPFSHISPLYYNPRSPALFAPAIVTSQGFTAGRFNPAGLQALISPGPGKFNTPNFYYQKMQSEDGSSVEFPHSNPVSRCSSNDETVHQQQQQQSMEPGHNPNVFQFPNIDTMGGEIKTEQMQGSSGIAKPRPVAPGSAVYHPGTVAMPYIQVTPHGHMYGYPGHSMVGNGYVDGGSGGEENPSVDHTNRNNNNSTHDGGNINLANLAVNPWHFIPKIVPTLPQSPGYFIQPTVSPGLPTTPTTSGTVFNFCSPPMVSPAKPPFKGAKPAPLSLSSSEGSSSAGQTTVGMINYPQVLAALPSPNYGTFLFPPVTPSGYIAPINLSELSGSGETPVRSQQQTPPYAQGGEQAPPPKKPRTDSSTPSPSDQTQ